MKWILDLFYVVGVSVAAVGLWWERPSWSLMFIGGAIACPVIVVWFCRVSGKSTKG